MMKIKECISLLKSFNSRNKKESAFLLESIQPAVTRLRNGERAFRIIKELVNEADYSRAAEFLKEESFSSRFPLPGRLRGILILFGFLIITGIICLVIGSSDYYYSRQSKNWSETKGIIVKSQVKKYKSYEDDTPSYSAEIEFNYRVDNKFYTSGRRTFNEIRIGENLGGKKIAEEIVKRYPVDTDITVYFNPENPGMAVLENKDVTPVSSVILICSGFLLLAISLISLIITIRRTECPGCHKVLTDQKIKIVENGYSEKYHYPLYSDLYECIRCGCRWKGKTYGLSDD